MASPKSGFFNGLIGNGGVFAPKQAAGYIEAIARAVQYAHQQGVLHRDLKPHNILFDANGRPHLADFGLAKQLQSEEGPTNSGRAMGTWGYAAPEQISDARRVGVTSDVYGLGATLYALLTGRPPFQAPNDADVLDHVRWHDPVPARDVNPTVPVDLDAVCLKCLHKHPFRRYPSAGDLADDLRRFLAGEAIRARRAGVAEKLGRWCRRQPALAGSLTTIWAGIIAFAAVATWLAVAKSRALERADRLAQEKQGYAGYVRELADTDFRLLGVFVLDEDRRLRKDVGSGAEKRLSPDQKRRLAWIQKDLGSEPGFVLLESVDRSLTHLEGLSPEDEKVASQRHMLAYYCTVYGDRQHKEGHNDEAERVFRLAVLNWERHLRQDADDLDAVNELSNCLDSLGVLARQKGRSAEQADAWKRSAQVLEAITGKNPEFDGNLGRTYYNLGVMAGNPYRLDEVIAWQTKAINILSPLCQAAPGRSDLKWFLSEAYIGRDVAWHDKGDNARALPDLEKAGCVATRDRQVEVVEFIKKKVRSGEKD